MAFNLGAVPIENMFVGSDYHFNHANVIKFDNRPFNSVAEMNQALVNNHNAITDENSVTFMVGDIAMGNSASQVVGYLNQMNGKKILIKGNHDHGFLKDEAFRGCFELIVDYYSPNINGTKVVMFHYPIYEWDKMHRGSIHLHGHIHTNQVPFVKDGKMLNVGIMNNNYKPFTMLEVFEMMESRPVRSHHGD